MNESLHQWQLQGEHSNLYVLMNPWGFRACQRYACLPRGCGQPAPPSHVVPGLSRKWAMGSTWTIANFSKAPSMVYTNRLTKTEVNTSFSRARSIVPRRTGASNLVRKRREARPGRGLGTKGSFYILWRNLFPIKDCWGHGVSSITVRHQLLAGATKT